MLLSNRKRRYHKIKGTNSERKRRTKKSSLITQCNKELPKLQENVDFKSLLKQKRRRRQSKHAVEHPSASQNPAHSNIAVGDPLEPLVFINSNLEPENEKKRKLVFTISQHKL